MSCGSKQPLKSCLRGSSGGGGGGGSSLSSVSSRTVTSRTSGGGRFSGSSCGGGSSRSSYAGGGAGSYGMSSSSCGGRLGGYGMGHSSMGTGFRAGGSGFGGGYGGGFGGGAAGFSAGSFGSGGFHGGNVGILAYDEKLTMQSLNERLASYMETVRNLEKENAQLEQLIREWYQKQGPIGPKDYSHYYGQIEELQKQIVAAAVETHKVLLDLDNTKMTAEDFRIKYEMETGLRQNVEGDLNSLRPLLDNLTLTKSDLEMQFESLKEEIIDLKKNHEEEMKQLQSQSNGDVNVKINAAPGEDLLKKLNEMRQEYEAIIQKNRAEVEKWYESKMEEVSQQVHSSSQEIESSNQQISVLRREFQSLEIELQSQISLIDSLQSNLEDTERRYNMQLQQIQGMIGPLEEELASIRCEMESQNEEYKMLLGIKTRLEQEIQQYRALLQEGQQGVSTSQGGAGGGSSGGGGGGHGGTSGGGSCWSPRSSGGKTEGSYGRSSSSESGGGGSGGRTGGGTCGKTSSGGGGSGGGGGGKSCLFRSSSSQSQPGDSCESPGSAENMKLCLGENKTLERGATMEEVSEAIKQMRRGSFRKAEE